MHARARIRSYAPIVKELPTDQPSCEISDFNTEDTKTTQKTRRNVFSREEALFFSVRLCVVCVEGFSAPCHLTPRPLNRYSLNPRLTSSLSTMASETSFIDLRR